MRLVFSSIKREKKEKFSNYFILFLFRDKFMTLERRFTSNITQYLRLLKISDYFVLYLCYVLFYIYTELCNYQHNQVRRYKFIIQ